MKKLLFGPFQLDITKRVVTGPHGEVLDLTGREFDILELLVENAGNIVQRETFHEKIWSQPNVGPTTLTTHISAIRRKLSSAFSPAQSYIQAVQNKGYGFCQQVTQSEDPPVPTELAALMSGRQPGEHDPQTPYGEPALEAASLLS